MNVMKKRSIFMMGFSIFWVIVFGILTCMKFYDGETATGFMDLFLVLLWIAIGSMWLGIYNKNK